MKALHISTRNTGGAGISALRLHEELLKKGIQSKLLTLDKYPTKIKEHYVLSKADYATFPKVTKIELAAKKIFLSILGLYKKYYFKVADKYLQNRPKGFDNFSFPISDIKLHKHPLVKWADIVHLHWVSEGMFDYSSFFKKINKKIVWTLHDMNAFTGGCHHADDCIGYQYNCSNCPQMKGTIDENIAEKMFSIKKKTLENIPRNQLTIITPSNWLSNLSKKSQILGKYPHLIINNIIDENDFYPIDKIHARKTLGLALNKKIILFVAYNVNHSRKGVHYLIEAISKINMPDLKFCAIGNMQKDLNQQNKILNLGYITDNKTMSLAYNAADVFILPSIAENFPNTIIEALCCGTPVIASKVGGVPEQVSVNNGILVDPLNANELANAIQLFFDTSGKYNRKEISNIAKKKYSTTTIIEKHITVYKNLLPSMD